MAGNVVARRYAKALIEVTEKEGITEAVLDDLRRVGEAIEESRHLQSIIRSPHINIRIKKGIIAEIAGRLGLNDSTSIFLQLLLEKGRLQILEAVISAYEECYLNAKNMVKASVLTPLPMTEEQRRGLEEKLSILTGKRVLLSVERDPNLIGGIVTRIGNTIYDGSVRSWLNSMREQMTKGGLN